MVVAVPELDGDPTVPPYTLFTETVKGFPEGDLVITPAPGQVYLNMGGQEATVQFNVMATDYPPLMLGDYHRRTDIDGDFFVRALEEVAVNAATDETRPVLNGVLLEVGEEATLVAADGFRLGVMSLRKRMPLLEEAPAAAVPADVVPAAEPVTTRRPRRRSKKGAAAPEPPAPAPAAAPSSQQLVIPLATVEALCHLWKKLDINPAASTSLMKSRRLGIEYRQGFIRFRIPAHWRGQEMLVTLTSLLIQGSFPSWPGLLPPSRGEGVVFQAQELASKVAFLAPIANEGSGIIRMVWGKDTLMLSAMGADSGSAGANVRAATLGSGKVAIAVRYLSSYLRGRTGTVAMECTGPASPAKFTHEGRSTVVLMPMFVAWEGEPAPEAPPLEAAPGEEEVEAS